MKYQQVVLGPRYRLLLPHDQSGYYCPFCGVLHGEYGMYDSNGNPSYDFICPDCNVQAGDDDVPANDASQSQDQYIQSVRQKWLNRVSWKAECIERLKHVFELSDDDINAIRNA